MPLCLLVSLLVQCPPFTTYITIWSLVCYVRYRFLFNSLSTLSFLLFWVFLEMI